jgi:uncharacterized protein involved in exopolysaccharide biosynthesis
MNSLNEDSELNFQDVLTFLKEQYKNILLIFISIFIVCLIYIFSRPTLYKSSSNLLIGKDIESVEQIRFLYSSETEINLIKNTSIIEIISKSIDLEKSKVNVNETINRILSSHEQIRNNKILQASLLLKAIQNDSKKELLDVLEKSSAINSTRQITQLSTETLKFSGLLKKGIIYSLLIALILSFLITFAIHILNKTRTAYGKLNE